MLKNTSQGLLLFLAAMSLLTAVTWALGLADIQYRDKTPIAFVLGFPGEVSEWQAAGISENIQINGDLVRIFRVAPGRSYAKRIFDLPVTSDNTGVMRITGTIKTEKPSARVQNGKPARFMVWFLNAERKAITYLTVQNLSGDFPEYRAERVIGVPENARFLVFALHNNESDGQFALVDAGASMVLEGTFYRLASTFMYLGWVLLLCFTVYWMSRTIKLWQTLVMTTLLAATVVGVLLPETITTQVVLPAFNRLIEILRVKGAYTLSPFYKLGHFVFFLLVSLFALSTLVKFDKNRNGILLVLILLAIATEGLQLHLFHRSTRITDLGIDLAGILLALILVKVFYRTNVVNQI